MFFPEVSAAMSSKSRYSTLEPNSAARSTDLDFDNGELHQFIRNEGGKDKSHGRADPLFWNRYFFMLVCAALAIALTAGGVGFHLGMKSTGSPSSSTIRVEAKGSKFYQGLSSRPGGAHGVPIKTRLYANDSFTENPLSTETNAAWLSLFPPGSGLIQHPELAPNISGIAMFHELHCLNNVRSGYYHLLLDPHHENETLQFSSISRRNEERRPQKSDLDPGHIAHCFEYLRQILMCVADTNLEPIDPDAGGVTGWGLERRCGDYDEVVEWATTWKSKTVKASHHHPNDHRD